MPLVPISISLSFQTHKRIAFPHPLVIGVTNEPSMQVTHLTSGRRHRAHPRLSTVSSPYMAASKIPEGGAAIRILTEDNEELSPRPQPRMDM